MGFFDSVGKFFKKITSSTIGKVLFGALGVAAVVFTGGAALGLGGIFAGGWGAAVAAGVGSTGLTGTLGGILTGAITQAGYGAVLGAATSAVFGGDPLEGAASGGLGGLVTGGLMSGLGMATDPLGGLFNNAAPAGGPTTGGAGSAFAPGTSAPPMPRATMLPGPASAPAASPSVPSAAAPPARPEVGLGLDLPAAPVGPVATPPTLPVQEPTVFAGTLPGSPAAPAPTSPYTPPTSDIVGGGGGTITPAGPAPEPTGLAAAGRAASVPSATPPTATPAPAAPQSGLMGFVDRNADLLGKGLLGLGQGLLGGESDQEYLARRDAEIRRSYELPNDPYERAPSRYQTGARKWRYGYNRETNRIERMPS